MLICPITGTSTRRPNAVSRCTSRPPGPKPMTAPCDASRRDSVMRRLIGAPGAVSGEMFTPRIPRLGSPGTRLSERTARTATALTSVFAGTTTWALTPCPKLSRCLEAGLTSIFLLDPSRTRARVGWEPRQQRSVQTRGPRKVACGLGLCERDATRGPAVAGAGATARMLTQQAPNVRRAAMLSCHLACPALKVVIVPQ